MLQPWRGKIPDAAFGPMVVEPRTDGASSLRGNLRQAQQLLERPRSRVAAVVFITLWLVGAGLLAWWLFGEAVSLTRLAGIGVIIVGVYIVSRS